MPTYVYRIIHDPADTRVEETFEIRQPMSDPPLTRHPQTGEAVERVIVAPSISIGKLGNASLNSAGFTKYARTSDGTYEKQSGSGPSHINPNEE